MQMQEYSFTYNERPITIHAYNPPDFITREIIAHNSFFELPYLELFTRKYPTQNIIIDIGANIGNHALYFANFLTYTHLYAFEPQQLNALLCHKNLAPFSDRTTVFPLGLSNTTTPMQLRTANYDNSGNFTIEETLNAVKTMHTPFLSHFYQLDTFHFANVSLIKIDVEGHELAVLEGARNTIAQNKPIITIENLHHLYTNIARNQHHAFFESVEYVLEEENVGGCYMDTWIPR